MTELNHLVTEQILQALRERRTGESARAGGQAPVELREILADCDRLQDMIGVVNPRPPGFLNALIQNAKRMMQRLLSWYTRSFDPFHGALIAAARQLTNLVQELFTRLARVELQMQGALDQSAEILERLEKIERRQAEAHGATLPARGVD